MSRISELCSLGQWTEAASPTFVPKGDKCRVLMKGQ